MKQALLFIVLSAFIMSCSSVNLNQKAYVDSLVECASDTKEFRIINIDEMEDFFDSDGMKIFVLKYEANKERGTIRLFRNIDSDSKEYYISNFRKFTLPFSKCRKIRAKKVYFE